MQYFVISFNFCFLHSNYMYIFVGVYILQVTLAIDDVVS